MTTSRTLVAGDTLAQDIVAPTDSEGTAYSASDGWTLAYRLIPRAITSTVIDITAVADGADYRLAVAAGDTAAWTAGMYGVSAYVTKGAETYTVEPLWDQVEIRANPRTAAAGLETRTQARKALDDARQALADAQARAANVGTSGSASGGLVEYSIGERRFKYANAAEAVESMIKAVSYWEAAVLAENCASARDRGLASPRNVVMRMGRA